MDLSLNFILIILGLIGFSIAFYIRRKKQTHGPLICPIGSDCDEVVHSKFSKFFGIPVELLGIFYYGLIIALYGAAFLGGYSYGDKITLGISFITVAAFLFSFYLTFIQFFTIKKICTWCIFSAIISTFIFLAVVINSQINYVDFFAANRTYIVMFHLLGVALGLGGATITDVFFFKFVKDFKISEWESETLSVLSEVIWFALALLILTGIGLYLPEAEHLSDSPKFLVKMIIVGVIIVNGSFLNLISPRLRNIFLGKQHPHEPGELHRLRKFAFAGGSISIVSWYSAFILGALYTVPFSFSQLAGAYILLLAFAVIASQVVDGFLVKKSLTQSGR